MICGIDVGGANCRLVVADLAGNPVAVSREATPVGIGGAALAEWLASRAVLLTARATVSPAGQTPLRAAAVGLPGMVTADGTTVTEATNLPQIEGQVFSRKLSRAMPAPVSLHNDSDLALLGEMRFGAGHGLDRAVMFTIGAGFGAGVFLDGTPLRGRRGLVGEFGHLPAGPSGEIVEEVLAGLGLVRHAQALRAPVSTAADVFAPENEELLAPVLERFDRALLLALTAATVAYEPSAIILGGGLSPAVARRLEVMRSRLASMVPEVPELRLAALGDLSGAFGALEVAGQAAGTPVRSARIGSAGIGSAGVS